jgi:hypothetical protein
MVVGYVVDEKIAWAMPMSFKDTASVEVTDKD